jgi:hypothetical protein
MAEISFKKRRKTCENSKNHGFLTDFLFDFIELYCVFQYSFDDISAICWRISMQNSILETLLVVDCMTEIWMWKFKNFMVKFGSEVVICWKSGICDHVFLNNSEVPNIFLGQVYFFWKLRMPAN